MYLNKPLTHSMSHLQPSWTSFSSIKFGSPCVANIHSTNRIPMRVVEWAHVKTKMSPKVNIQKCTKSKTNIQA